MKHLSKSAILGASMIALLLTGCAANSNTARSSDSDEKVEFPTENITYVVPYPAGSAPDASARVIAQSLEEQLGVSVIVENAEGGASTLGLYELAGSDADGYTIGTGASTGVSVQSRIIDTPFEGLDSLTAVAQINVVPSVLFTRADTGWDGVEDFISEAKDRPGEITVGVPNPGSIQDIQLALLEEAAGIDVEAVYFDAGQQILPVVNGTIDAAVAQPGPVTQYVEKGDLAWVGVLGDQAPEGLDAELFADAGYEIGFVGYEGVFAPAGLDPAVAQILSDAVQTAVDSDAYQEYAAKTFGIASFLNAEDFAAETAEQDKAAADVVTKLGLGSK